MMEMRECKLFIGNLSVCEQLSWRKRAVILECSKMIEKVVAFSKTSPSCCYSLLNLAGNTKEGVIFENKCPLNHIRILFDITRKNAWKLFFP